MEKIQPDEGTFFLYDHLGNTRVAFQVDGSNIPLIVNALDYYSYGKILREYDNGAGDRYLTTGHERDKETGLDYRGARYYDSDFLYDHLGNIQREDESNNFMYNCFDDN